MTVVQSANRWFVSFQGNVSVCIRVFVPNAWHAEGMFLVVTAVLISSFASPVILYIVAALSTVAVNNLHTRTL